MEPQPTAVERLLSIRESIDNIDAALVHLLAERFKFTQTVGYLKADAGMPPSDPDREVQQIKRLRTIAAESHLDPDFTEKFLNFIVAEVIQHHVRIASGDDPTGPISTSGLRGSAASDSGARESEARDSDGSPE